jgi:hypothetical protein
VSRIPFSTILHLSQSFLVMYTSKKRLQTSTALNVLEAVDMSAPFSPHSSSQSFRPVGEVRSYFWLDLPGFSFICSPDMFLERHTT